MSVLPKLESNMKIFFNVIKAFYSFDIILKNEQKSQFLQCLFVNFCFVVTNVLCSGRGDKRAVKQKIDILTWHRGYCDQQGSSPRSRLFHCTSVELKPAIPPNVGNSGA